MFSTKKNSSATKLEVENKKMEDRLRILKEMMGAEKARRESDGGIYWQSGKSGPLQIANKQPSTSISQGPLLSNDTKKPIKIRILTEKDTENKPTLPRCGQCEKASASLNCVECIENYCQVCFTQMHQKGGLAKHHVKPILRNIKHVSPQKTSAKAPTTSSIEPPLPSKGEQKTSFLEGTYDEASSAKSFQEALVEWRNGKNVATAKSSATCTVKDSFTETTSEVATMAGTTREPQTTEFNLEFTDKNKVTYFEKLLMRKYRDSTITMQSSVHHPVPTEIESEEESENVPAISEYNLFYDSEDMALENGDDEAIADGVIEPSIHTDENIPTMAIASDYTSIPVPSSVSIEELASSNEGMALVEPKFLSLSPGEGMRMDGSISKEIAETSTKGPAAATDTRRKIGKRKNGSENGHTKKSKGKERLAGSSSSSCNGREKGKQSEPSPFSRIERDTQHLKQSDLLVSVRSAWANCTQSRHNSQQLGHFFLHGVQPVDSNEEEMTASSEPPAPNSSDSLSQFKLMSTVWLPSSSTVQLETEVVPCGISESAGGDPPPSRPSTRDWYYNDTDSDSEPENEREEFIQSRMGMERDSMECVLSRPATSRDLEVAEDVERDRDDCEALEELAWELTSTAECEGRLTRCEGDIDTSDLEGGDGEHDTATPVPMVNEEGGEMGVVEEQVVLDMSEVISEFDLYQKRLMEEDSDQEQ